jgi:hypothetical protein
MRSSGPKRWPTISAAPPAARRPSRKQSADRLGEATSEKHDKTCWQLVLVLLRAELAREGPGGKTEEKVSGEVIESCLNAFRKIATRMWLADMLKLARAKAEIPRLRAYAVWDSRSGAT